jgi:hypothetical protein
LSSYQLKQAGEPSDPEEQLQPIEYRASLDTLYLQRKALKALQIHLHICSNVEIYSVGLKLEFALGASDEK